MATAFSSLAPQAIEIPCRDGVVLGGHLWSTDASPSGGNGTVIINPATGVLARYYHPYARFLTEHGFDVVTFDYRGIGLSRPVRLQGCGYRWRDWGELDFDAVLRAAKARAPDGRLLVVGHSIGGYLPGLAERGAEIDLMLTVGAQYAYWRDYAPQKRALFVLKWHLLMPVLIAILGYFPGRRLGWLEDLPKGVANEWSFRRARMELTHPSHARAQVLRRFASVSAPILAVGVEDDDLAPMSAIRRTLGYYSGARATAVLLSPGDYGMDRIGHFSLFHARHAQGFWRDTLLWLRDGINPWPHKAAPHHGVPIRTPATQGR